MAVRERDIRIPESDKQNSLDTKVALLDTYWKKFLHQLINIMIYAQTTEHVDVVALEKIVKALRIILRHLRDELGSKAEIYQQQYRAIIISETLLIDYDTKKQEKLIELREELEKYTKLRLQT